MKARVLFGLLSAIVPVSKYAWHIVGAQSVFVRGVDGCLDEFFSLFTDWFFLKDVYLSGEIQISAHLSIQLKKV